MHSSDWVRKFKAPTQTLQWLRNAGALKSAHSRMRRSHRNDLVFSMDIAYGHRTCAGEDASLSGPLA
jgi:hypothetical protein